MTRGFGIAALVLSIISIFATFPFSELVIWAALTATTIAALGRGGRSFAVASWIVTAVSLFFLSPLTLYMISESAKGGGPRGPIDANITGVLFLAPIVAALVGGLGSLARRTPTSDSDSMRSFREPVTPPPGDAPHDVPREDRDVVNQQAPRRAAALPMLLGLVVLAAMALILYPQLKGVSGSGNGPTPTSAQVQPAATPAPPTIGPDGMPLAPSGANTPTPPVIGPDGMPVAPSGATAPAPAAPAQVERPRPPGVLGFDVQGVMLGDTYEETYAALQREYSRSGDNLRTEWSNPMINLMGGVPPPAEQWREVSVSRPQSDADAGIVMTLKFVPAALNDGRAALYSIEANFVFPKGDISAAVALRDRLKAKYGQWDWGQASISYYGQCLIQPPEAASTFFKDVDKNAGANAAITLLWGGQPAPSQGYECPKFLFDNVKVKLLATLDLETWGIGAGRMKLELVNGDLLQSAVAAAHKLQEEEIQHQQQQVAPDRQHF